MDWWSKTEPSILDFSTTRPMLLFCLL